jgi:hypothetical protein
MTSRELAVIGKALKALIKAGLMEDVTEIVDYMAETDKTAAKEKE